MTETVPRRSETAARPAAARLSPTASRRAPRYFSARRTRRWPSRYAGVLVATDALCAIVAVALGWTLRFGFATDVAVQVYLELSAVIVAVWLACLQGADAYEVQRISLGAREYQRVLRAGLHVAGVVAIVGYLSGILLARTFVAIVIPSGMVLMVVTRWFVRRRVYANRTRGDWTTAILVVGTADSVRHVLEELSRAPRTGLVAVGACCEDAETGSEIVPGVPVVGSTRSASGMAEQMDVDVVAVAGEGMGRAQIRELAWSLEGTPRQMVMAPGLTGVAGPRVHVSPVEGLSLMWVDQPRFSGLGRIVKRGLDIVGSGLLLLLASPFLLVIAAAVRLTSSGPVLFKQRRLGQGGEWVQVLKFRTMYVDAEDRLADLMHLNESTDPLFFKVREDPRITPLGRILRRYSLDELPQLINIFFGSMSLVGPRPLPGELDLYDDHFRRRMMVKPGLTGLWQVSGRSDLSAEDAVRLDLYYVENWSLTLDIAIIFRTIWVVLRTRGAY